MMEALHFLMEVKKNPIVSKNRQFSAHFKRFLRNFYAIFNQFLHHILFLIFLKPGIGGRGETKNSTGWVATSQMKALSTDTGIPNSEQVSEFYPRDYPKKDITQDGS
jgi:Na+/H+ antiporter NhaC